MSEQTEGKKRRLTVAKFGGGVIGYNGANIPLVVKRIQTIRERSEIGPLVIVSAFQGLTNLAIKVGNDYASSARARARLVKYLY